MAYKLKSKAGRKKKQTKVWELRTMIPKKYRKGYTHEYKDGKVYLRRKEG